MKNEGIEMRRNGMLLPIASLPSPYGIGGFSKEAYEFIDLLEETLKIMFSKQIFSGFSHFFHV